MGRTSPQCLSSAGGLLLAAGFVAAATGGLYGLAAYRPGLVVLSVLLVMGYSVTGYLLLSRRDAAFTPAAVMSTVLLVATLWLFESGVVTVFGPEFTFFLLFPALATLLALAGANLVAYALARRNRRVLWPARGVGAASGLLQAAAVAPVLGVFVLLYLGGGARPGTFEAGVAVALAIGAAVASAAGGLLAGIKRHPRFPLVGGSVGFLANVLLLFEFSARGPVGYLGQVIALAGMLVAAFPVASSVVAWVELEAAKREAGARTGPTGKAGGP